MLIARETLARLGVEERTISDYVEQFRVLDRQRLLAQMDYGPEAGTDFMHQRFSVDGKP